MKLPQKERKSVMKLFNRLIAAGLSICCLAGLTGCEDEAPVSGSSQPMQTTSATTATMKEEYAQIVSDIDFKDVEVKPLEKPVVKFLCSWGINPVEGQPISIQLELFQTQYGGRVEDIITAWDDRYDRLATLVAADDAPDMFSAEDMDIVPKGVISGMFMPLDDYVNFDSELWAPLKATNDKFTHKGKHYVGATGVDSDCVMFYNKKTIADNGLDDPAELLAAGNWNWDTFRNMMVQFCNRDDNKFAVDGWWFEGGFSNTCGVPYIGTDENGKLIHNLDSEMITKVQDFMLDMKNNDLPVPKSDRAWEVHPELVASGETLFYPIGLYALDPNENIIQNFGEREDVMFVPLPKCPEADKYYLPCKVNGFALCKGAKNPEGVAAYLNCCMAGRKSEQGEELSRKIAFEEQGYTEEQYEMKKIVIEMTEAAPVVELYNAVTSKVAEYINNPMKEGYNSGASWTQTKEMIRAAVQKELDDANAKLDAIN